MSAEHVQRIVDRAMTDVGFRELLARDPGTALGPYDLTAEERAKFASGTARVERLEPRMSKSDLTAGMGVKTGTVDVRPPSRAGGKDRSG